VPPRVLSRVNSAPAMARIRWIWAWMRAIINREETRRRGRRRWGLRKQRRKRKGPAIELPASDGARHYCPALQHPLACIASRDGSTTFLSYFSPLFLSSAVVKAIFLCQKKKIIRNIAEPFFYSKHLAYYQVKIANYMASLFHLQCEWIWRFYRSKDWEWKSYRPSYFY